MAVCSKCDGEYDIKERKGKPGLLTVCSDCAEEPTIKYTGNMVFADKTAPEIQINADPRLTAYIKGGSVKHSTAPKFKDGACVKPTKLSPHRRGIT